jgi:hypothetical protein
MTRDWFIFSIIAIIAMGGWVMILLSMTIGITTPAVQAPPVPTPQAGNVMNGSTPQAGEVMNNSVPQAKEVNETSPETTETEPAETPSIRPSPLPVMTTPTPVQAGWVYYTDYDNGMRICKPDDWVIYDNPPSQKAYIDANNQANVRYLSNACFGTTGFSLSSPDNLEWIYINNEQWGPSISTYNESSPQISEADYNGYINWWIDQMRQKRVTVLPSCSNANSLSYTRTVVSVGRDENPYTINGYSARHFTITASFSDEAPTKIEYYLVLAGGNYYTESYGENSVTPGPSQLDIRTANQIIQTFTLIG